MPVLEMHVCERERRERKREVKISQPNQKLIYTNIALIILYFIMGRVGPSSESGNLYSNILKDIKIFHLLLAH